jgi:hypothetical protein
MTLRPLFLLLMAAAAAGFSGCAAPPEDPNATAFQAPLIYPAPVTRPGGGGTGKWAPLPRKDGSEYVQVIGDLEDIVSFYGFSSAVAPEIKNFDDMAALMVMDSSLGFRNLERGQILGVPVLWFEKTAADTGPGAPGLAELLKVKPRRSDAVYKVRTRGVFLFQPGPQPRFVTIACARTSAHGEIGALYESQFRAWLTGIVERCFL